MHDFFEFYKADLMAGFFGKITTGEAVLKTLKEIEEMEDVLFDYTEDLSMVEIACSIFSSH